jgi:large subunit ribosomal protein L32
MAVPKRKISKSQKRKRRTHFKIQVKSMAVCPNCGEITLSHTVCRKCGFYKGKLVVAPKAEKAEVTETSEKVEKVEKTEKAAKTEKAPKAAKTTKTTKTTKAAKAETE